MKKCQNLPRENNLWADGNGLDKICQKRWPKKSQKFRYGFLNFRFPFKRNLKVDFLNFQKFSLNFWVVVLSMIFSHEKVQSELFGGGFGNVFFHHELPDKYQFGVLNATLDLAALVLVGVAAILGSEVVLSPVVSGCLPSCGGWVLVDVVGFLGSEVVLSPVVSGCLPSCGGRVLVGVVGFLGSEVVLSPVVSGCLPSCGLVWLPSSGWCGRLLGL